MLDAMKHAVAKAGEVQPGQCKLVEIDGREIGVFFVNGQHRAYRNVCPHAGAPICQGRPVNGASSPDIFEYDFGLSNEVVRCPWHGWEFDLNDGEHVMSSLKLKSYEVSVEGEEIFIEVP